MFSTSGAGATYPHTGAGAGMYSTTGAGADSDATGEPNVVFVGTPENIFPEGELLNTKRLEPMKVKLSRTTHTRSHKEEIQNRRIQKANPSTSEREMVFQTNVTLCGQTEKHKERPRQTHETTQQRNTKHATRVTQNKTRQEKTGQDETRRDETGQVHIQSERTFTDISA